MSLQRVGLIAVLNMTQFNRAYNQYIRRLGIMNVTTKRTSQSLSSQFLGLGSSLLKIAGILSGAVVIGAGLATAALTKMAIGAIKEAADLEQELANIASTMNITTGEAGFLKDVIIDLGLDPRLRVTTFEAAEAMGLLAKNGVFAGQSVQEMEITAREAGTAVILLANATGAEFGQAANIASSVMAIFNKEATDMIDIVSGITSVTTNSKFTINDYEVALRNGGAAAAIMGVSLEDFNTIVAASAEELGTGMKAGTGLLNFMNRLTPNTNKATDAMKELGIITADGKNRFFDASGELKSMAEVSLILNDALFGTTKVMGEVGGRTGEQNKLLGELNAEYSDAQKTIEKYTSGIDSLLASEDEKNEAISEAQEIMEKLSPTMAELNGIQGELIESTSTLTSEQRSMALETIFGNDAMKTTIAIAEEGNLVVGRLSEVTAAYGISFQEAAKMVEDGLTEFELMQQVMSKTDAIQNAETRMDTLKGKLEILGGVFEAVRIAFGDEFIEFLTTLAEKFLAIIEDQDDILGMVGDFGAALSDMFEALINGEGAFKSFTGFLDDIGRSDLAVKLFDIQESIRDFITPIREFIDEHSEEFIGALKGIGAVLAGSAIAALLAGVASAIGAILSPLGLLLIAVATLGAMWESNWMDIQGVTKSAVKKISKFLDEIGVLEFVDNLRDAFGEGGFKGLIEAIPDALSGMGNRIKSAFLEWFTGVDWMQVGTDIITSLFDAMTSAGEGVGNLANMFVEWVATVDWETVGEKVVDGLLTAIGVIFALNALQFQAIFKFFEAVINTIDWSALAIVLGTAFIGLVSGIWDRASELDQIMKDGLKEHILNPLILGIANGKESVRESAITLVDGVITALETFPQTVLQPLGQWWISITDWMHTITWEDVGFFITTAILTVFVGFPVKILETLATWWETFQEWQASVDWESMAQSVNDRIVAIWVAFPKTITATLKLWFETIKGWFDETDWETEGAKPVDRINEVLKKAPTLIRETLNKWFEDIKLWFDEQDWSSLGSRIIDGLVDGIKGGLATAQAAIMGVAEGVKGAWDAFFQTQSPSKLMMQSGVDIMKGADLGIVSEGNSIMSTMANIGSDMFQSFNNSVSDVLPNSPATNNTISNSNQTTNNFNVENSFAGQPQINDADGLRIALAGFG